MLTDDNITTRITTDLPSCATELKCLCAGHANGLAASAPCDTTEPVGARLEWGSWPVPYAATVAWGARAIYRLDVHDTQYRRGKVIRRAGTTAVIDLLYDRQGAAARDGAPERDRKALATWLNKTAMPALRRECVKRYVTSDCEAMIEIESDGFKLVAGPRGSCGYLYIRAWKVG